LGNTDLILKLIKKTTKSGTRVPLNDDTCIGCTDTAAKIWGLAFVLCTVYIYTMYPYTSGHWFVPSWYWVDWLRATWKKKFNNLL
jgi:hypothetical protein